jgi:hypothetical protein
MLVTFIPTLGLVAALFGVALVCWALERRRRIAEAEAADPGLRACLEGV